MPDRIINLDKEAKESVEQLIKLFREKFGRDPGPEDPLVFDPDADTPQPMPEGKMESIMGDIAIAAGLPPRFVYAIQRTGLLVTENNRHLIPEEKLQAWNEALLEYEINHGSEFN